MNDNNDPDFTNKDVYELLKWKLERMEKRIDTAHRNRHYVVMTMLWILWGIAFGFALRESDLHDFLAGFMPV